LLSIASGGFSISLAGAIRLKPYPDTKLTSDAEILGAAGNAGPSTALRLALLDFASLRMTASLIWLEGRIALKQKIQIVLVVVVVLATARTGYILYERHAASVELAKPAPPLNPDYYVTPKRLHAYDLKSARELTQQPVWVKVGYSIAYYPYASHHVDFSHEAGQLLPIEKLSIKDVVTSVAPSAPIERQLMAVFEQDGKSYAFSIGSEQDSNYEIYSDDMLFIQDPHELYKHWPADVWAAIDKHEVKPGMNELQTDFAIGLGIPEGTGDSWEKVVDYANGGKPLVIVYRDGKAAEIRPGP